MTSSPNDCCSRGKCSAPVPQPAIVPERVLKLCCDVCTISNMCCGTGCCLVSCCLGKMIRALPIPSSMAQSVANVVGSYQRIDHQDVDDAPSPIRSSMPLDSCQKMDQRVEDVCTSPVRFWMDGVGDPDDSISIIVDDFPSTNKQHNNNNNNNNSNISEALVAATTATPLSSTRTCRISIHGLTCADCSLLVENTLAKCVGILTSRVSCLTHEGTVEYDPTVISPSKISDIINGTGFVARLIRDDSTADAVRGGRIDHLSLNLIVFAPIIQPHQASSIALSHSQLRDLRTALLAVTGVATVGETSHVTTTVPDKLISLPGLTDHADMSSSLSTSNIADVRVKAVEMGIEYDATKTGPRDIIATVVRLGLWAHVPSASEIAARNGGDHHASDMWRHRVPVGILLSIPMIFLAFIIPTGALGRSADDALDTEVIRGRQGLSVRALVSFLLTTPIQFYVGSPLFTSAYRAAWFSKTANIDTLVVISSSVAYFYSVAIIIAKLAGASLADHDFFEAPAILITLIVLGRWLEAISKGKASESVRKLASMQATSALWLPYWKPQSSQTTNNITCSSNTLPSINNNKPDSCCRKSPTQPSSCSADEPKCKSASNCCDDKNVDINYEYDLDVSLIHRGDYIKVLPGSKIPTDGTVVDGSSSVDESSLTGESMPVGKAIDDVVYGGTINGQGVLYVRVTKAASENMLSSISALVRQAQASKPDAQRFADRLAARFVPFILLLSLSIFFIWLGVSLGGHIDLPSDMSSLTFSLQFALATLVVSCPCAIGLAVPTAIMVATGVAAKYGILFKGGVELEMTHRITAIVFDKTGTLTIGRPVVTKALMIPRKSESVCPSADLLPPMSSTSLSSPSPHTNVDRLGINPPGCCESLKQPAQPAPSSITSSGCCSNKGETLSSTTSTAKVGSNHCKPSSTPSTAQDCYPDKAAAIVPPSSSCCKSVRSTTTATDVEQCCGTVAPNPLRQDVLSDICTEEDEDDGCTEGCCGEAVQDNSACSQTNDKKVSTAVVACNETKGCCSSIPVQLATKPECDTTTPPATSSCNKASIDPVSSVPQVDACDSNMNTVDNCCGGGCCDGADDDDDNFDQSCNDRSIPSTDAIQTSIASIRSTTSLAAPVNTSTSCCSNISLPSSCCLSSAPVPISYIQPTEHKSCEHIDDDTEKCCTGCCDDPDEEKDEELDACCSSGKKPAVAPFDQTVSCCGSSTPTAPTAIITSSPPSDAKEDGCCSGKTTAVSSCSGAVDQCDEKQPTRTTHQLSEADFWFLVGSAEQESEHPIATTIVTYARNWLLEHDFHRMILQSPTGFMSVPGKGLFCEVNGRSIAIGNRSIMGVQSNSSGCSSSDGASKDSCCSKDVEVVAPMKKPDGCCSSVAVVDNYNIPSDILQQVEDLESSGNTVVYVSVDGIFSGVIAVADTVRSEASAVVRSLSSMGIEVWMMSGDQPRTASAVAATLGIDPQHVFGGLLPGDKASKIAELQAKGHIVGMVGDGVNDSPALAQANIGIGMASGTDVAMESAQVVLVKSNLHDVLTAIDLSRVTFRRIRLNFIWAFIYNVVGIILAAGTFYYVGHVSIPPAFAGLSELLSSLPVVLFSLLLKSYKPQHLASL